MSVPFDDAQNAASVIASVVAAAAAVASTTANQPLGAAKVDATPLSVTGVVEPRTTQCDRVDATPLSVTGAAKAPPPPPPPPPPAPQLPATSPPPPANKRLRRSAAAPSSSERALLSWNGLSEAPQMYGGSNAAGRVTLWWTARPSAIPSRYTICATDEVSGEVLMDLGSADDYAIGKVVYDERLAVGRGLRFQLLRMPLYVTEAGGGHGILATAPSDVVVVGHGLSRSTAFSFHRIVESNRCSGLLPPRPRKTKTSSGG